MPYNGTGPLTTDLMGGQVDLAFISITAVAPHIRSGKLKALAVSTAERSTLLPDVPALREAGLPHYAFDAWIALIGPAKLPEPLIQDWEQALTQALQNPAVQNSFAQQGIALTALPRAQLPAYLEAESKKYAELVARSGAKLE